MRSEGVGAVEQVVGSIMHSEGTHDDACRLLHGAAHVRDASETQTLSHYSS